MGAGRLFGYLQRLDLASDLLELQVLFLDALANLDRALEVLVAEHGLERVLLDQREVVFAFVVLGLGEDLAEVVLLGLQLLAGLGEGGHAVRLLGS